MSAESRYNQLTDERDRYLNRAREAAALTIPYLVPRGAYVDGPVTETYEQPWSGIGARGVNNLASRLMLALLPPTEPFFRFTIDEQKKAENRRLMQEQAMAEATDPQEAAAVIAQQESEFDVALAALERSVLRSIEATNDRVAVFQALLQLIVPGNCLLLGEADGLRYFPLHRYVLLREPNGMPLEAVVCESVQESQLPEEALLILMEQMGAGTEDATADPQRTHKVFTHIQWEDGRVKWHQEIGGKEIDGTEGTARADESPWIPLRMYAIDGCSYSPGYVETKCQADLETANALTQALMEGSLVAARTVFGCKPGSMVTPKQFTSAKNGDTLKMNPDDVFPVQANRQADLAVTQQALAKVSADLSAAFMLSSVRDSERTTAEEVRLQALEIENSLGAIYAILTSEFQAPFIRWRLSQLTKDKALPQMPAGLVQPVVSVGLAAVGRGNDLEKIARFMQLGQQFAGPEFMARVNLEMLFKDLASSVGLSIVGLIKPEAQVRKEMAEAQQAQQEAAMAQAALTAPSADPQRLATAAQTMQEMGGASPPDPTTQPTEETL